MVTKEDLKKGFAELGLRAGMKVNVHSSLSSFGHVEGGADTVIDALMETLTEEGTLMMPSFNHGAPYQHGEIFDVRKTKSVSGIITDTFWRREGVRRSLNCTHPFAVWGKDADRYVANLTCEKVCEDASPIGQMYHDGGYVLLLGVDYGSNTFHHFVEESVNCPCLELSKPYPAKGWNGEDYEVRTWNWRNGRCPFDDPQWKPREVPRYTADMDASGVAKKIKIGEATVTFYAMQEAYPIILKNLTDGGHGFPPCSGCTIRPAKNNF